MLGPPDTLPAPGLMVPYKIGLLLYGPIPSTKAKPKDSVSADVGLGGCLSRLVEGLPLSDLVGRSNSSNSSIRRSNSNSLWVR